MKKLIGVGIALVSSTAFASVIYKPGILCDSKAGFCADSEGVSVSVTETELGAKAGKKLMADINKVGINDFDATTFTMSGGLNCNTKEKKCYTNRYDKKVDIKATKTLFGN